MPWLRCERRIERAPVANNWRCSRGSRGRQSEWSDMAVPCMRKKKRKDGVVLVFRERGFVSASAQIFCYVSAPRVRQTFAGLSPARDESGCDRCGWRFTLPHPPKKGGRPRSNLEDLTPKRTFSNISYFDPELVVLRQVTNHCSQILRALTASIFIIPSIFLISWIWLQLSDFFFLFQIMWLDYRRE